MSCSDNLLEIEALRWGGNGDAVGCLPEGKTVFLAGAIPGERVLARIVAEKKRFALAETEQVLSAAPGRVEPVCPHYTDCGGCALQHVDYDTELRLKQQIVKQSLYRLGGLEVETPLPLTAPSPLGYRSRAVLHYDRGRLGFYNENSRAVADLDHCRLLLPALNSLLKQVRPMLFEAADQLRGLRGVGLRCDGAGLRLLLTFICDKSLPILDDLAAELRAKKPALVSVWENSGAPVYGPYGGEWRLLQGKSRLRDEVGPVLLDLSPGSFTQVDPAQTIVLYDLVRQYTGLSGDESVLDLFSGVGSIALYLAPYAGKVTGVESYAPAVTDAVANAALNGAGNCRFHCGRAEDILPRWAAQGRSFDLAILDPPRSGCDKRLLEALAAIAPPRLVYVSCDPATLSRDLKLLTGRGYCVEQVQPVDMFPRTCHVETVVLLSRK